MFASENSFCVESGFACDVDEADADFGWRRRILIRIDCGSLVRIAWWRGGLFQMEGTRESEDVLQRQDKSGTAERFKKSAT